jgi:hypothetical protein
MDLEYHWQRAQQEREQAQRAEHAAVANAHWELAALHVGCIKALDEECSGSTVGRR